MSNIVQALTRKFVQARVALYTRVGYDRRLMEFRADGRIGRGAGLLERSWRVTQDGEVCLEGKQGIICRFVFDEKSSLFKGRWLFFEQMPVELELMEWTLANLRQRIGDLLEVALLMEGRSQSRSICLLANQCVDDNTGTYKSWFLSKEGRLLLLGGKGDQELIKGENGWVTSDGSFLKKISGLDGVEIRPASRPLIPNVLSRVVGPDMVKGQSSQLLDTLSPPLSRTFSLPSFSSFPSFSIPPPVPLCFIFHGLNFFRGGSERLDRVQEQVRESIGLARKYQTHCTAFVVDGAEYSGFASLVLEWHSGTSFGDRRQLPFIKDMLDGLAARAQDLDWLMISNSDCCVEAHTYDRLHSYKDSEVVLFVRLDVPCGNYDPIGEMFLAPTYVFSRGLDGIALRKRVYVGLREEIPDFVLGEPCWDGAVARLLSQAMAGQVFVDTGSLYHIEHQRSWSVDKLSKVGHYNQSLAQALYLRVEGLQDCDVLVETKVTDTLLVVFVGCTTSVSEGQLKGCLAYLMGQQTLKAPILIVEVVLEKEGSRLTGIASELGCEHKVVEVSRQAATQNVQPKAFNAVVETHPGIEFFIFLEAGLYFTKVNALFDIRSRVSVFRDSLVQGFSYVQDRTGSVVARSLARQYERRALGRIESGLCWAISRETWECMGGFNEGVLKDGIELTVAEICGDRGKRLDHIPVLERAFLEVGERKLLRNFGGLGLNLGYVENAVIVQDPKP